VIPLRDTIPRRTLPITNSLIIVANVVAFLMEVAQGSGLERFLDTSRSVADAAPRDRAAAETRNLADVAHAMTRCALFREESRGAHFRSDFPERDDQRFRGHTLLDAGALHLTDVEQPLQVKV